MDQSRLISTMRRCKEACARAFSRLVDNFRTKRAVVDTMVVIVLSWATGIFNEVYLVGMPWDTSLRTRAMGTFTNLLTAGLYGWYYDTLRHQTAPWVIGKLFGHAAVDRLFSPEPDPSRSLRFARRVYAIFVGYLAFITFQSQVYRLNLWIGGATSEQANQAVGLATAIFPIVIEFVFSPILDAVRRFFNVAPPETRIRPSIPAR